MKLFMFPVLPEGEQKKPELLARNPFGKLPALDYLERLLDSGGSFLAGSQVAVGDCTLAEALQFGRFRELDFLVDHPALSRWDAEYRARPAATSVLVL